MLIRNLKRLIFLIVPTLFLLLILIKYYQGNAIALPFHANDWIQKSLSKKPKPAEEQHQPPAAEASQSLSSSPTKSPPPLQSIDIVIPPDTHKVGDDNGSHREVYSVSTKDQKYFLVKFGGYDAINPNIIAHPTLNDTWIIVAQKHKHEGDDPTAFTELVCNAVFKDDALKCLDPPMALPVLPTRGGKCSENLAFFTLNVGPHDARVFYGPKKPYTIYGSNSAITCFGLWIQDFRELWEWGLELFYSEEFRTGTELQRPEPWSPVEKNWFIFWDKNEQMYLHHDVVPQRVFAKLEADGSVGPDLGPQAVAKGDGKCTEKYMPKADSEYESIHQATNSLSITLCRRVDPKCKPNDKNTFILSVFQHKKFYYFHSVYEPYAMLFDRTSPFKIHAISKKPFWINGRGMIDPTSPKEHQESKKPDTPSPPAQPESREPDTQPEDPKRGLHAKLTPREDVSSPDKSPDAPPDATPETETKPNPEPDPKAETKPEAETDPIPKEETKKDDAPKHVAKQTEMFYITSINWKTRGQKYHGYIDDVLFIGFGIEDVKTAGIDVVAGDLVLDLGLC